MEYAAFVFAIFGLMAYVSMSSLKNRVSALEDQLSKMKGTMSFESRDSLRKLVTDNIGKTVYLKMREDYTDQDIYLAVYQKKGITILDADEGWVLVSIETPKKTLTKLIRIESIQSVDVVKQY